MSGLAPPGTLVIPPHLLRAGTRRATLTFCFYTCEKTHRTTRNDECYIKCYEKEAAEEMSGFAVGVKLHRLVAACQRNDKAKIVSALQTEVARLLLKA